VFVDSQRLSVADPNPHGSASFWEAGSGSASASKWKGSPLEGHFGALEGPNLEKSEWQVPDPSGSRSESIDRSDPDPHQSER
jgi:hypothetical protein